MCNCGIGGDDEIKAADHRSGVDEGIWSVVEVFAQRLNRHVIREFAKLVQAMAFLQAYQANTRKPSQRKVFLQGIDRPLINPALRLP